jgi:hypothetical protein
LSPLLAGRHPTGVLGLIEGVALLPDRSDAARLRSVRAHGDHVFLQYTLR